MGPIGLEFCHAGSGEGAEFCHEGSATGLGLERCVRAEDLLEIGGCEGMAGVSHEGKPPLGVPASNTLLWVSVCVWLLHVLCKKSTIVDNNRQLC